jgi:hypothetical protein
MPEEENVRKFKVKDGEIEGGEGFLDPSQVFPPEPPEGMPIPPPWWRKLVLWARRIEGKIDSIEDALTPPGQSELGPGTLYLEIPKFFNDRKAVFIWGYGRTGP